MVEAFAGTQGERNAYHRVHRAQSNAIEIVARFEPPIAGRG